MPPQAKADGKLEREARQENKAIAQARAAEELSTAELISYYRSRLEGFEAERAELLQRLDQCAIQGAEMHVLEWEAHKRADEVRELQKALSDAHNFLFDERQRLLALQAENDELRLQEIQDRKSIQQLLALQQGGAGAGGRHQQGGAGGLPGPNVDHLLLQIESLQAQLNEQKQLASERIAALLEDRRIREAEEEAHRRQLAAQLEAASERLARLEEQLRTTTKDYIVARREKQAAEERALEAQMSLAAERQASLEQGADARRRAAAELAAVRQEAEDKLADVESHLRAQLKTKEEELINLSSVHTTSAAAYDRRVQELELKVARLAEANKQLELRRALDVEGWAADVSALRKMLTAVDIKLHEMRLVERLEDDDRLDAILHVLRKKAPKVALPGPAGGGKAGGGHHHSQHQGGGGEVQSVKSALAEGLQDVRHRVRELEQRLADKQKQMPASGGAAAASSGGGQGVCDQYASVTTDDKAAGAGGKDMAAGGGAGGSSTGGGAVGNSGSSGKLRKKAFRFKFLPGRDIVEADSVWGYEAVLPLSAPLPLPLTQQAAGQPQQVPGAQQAPQPAAAAARRAAGPSGAPGPGAGCAEA
ncbi:hypothetical protein HYH02_012632 [Chlamydomonas schloesseri]|uniref:Uncharacterized protein n=1 Tax=Chlamydomonas schloesseri TaxID=2026947 RepID=A0A835W1H6_9CHLO|nr:hypothetical protein HYH02_012632 [Chlamydomonas schloesseri]|eukprot:KAG2433514.1 hypothetical protein HYH02_012632 [Chlamydomonas schloesseri]